MFPSHYGTIFYCVNCENVSENGSKMNCTQKWKPKIQKHKFCTRLNYAKCGDARSIHTIAYFFGLFYCYKTAHNRWDSSSLFKRWKNIRNNALYFLTSILLEMSIFCGFTFGHIQHNDAGIKYLRFQSFFSRFFYNAIEKCHINFLVTFNVWNFLYYTYQYRIKFNNHKLLIFTHLLEVNVP